MSSIEQKLYFILDLEQMIGKNRLTLRRWWTANKFPKPTLLHGTRLCWHKDDIEKWMKGNFPNER